MSSQAGVKRLLAIVLVVATISLIVAIAFAVARRHAAAARLVDDAR